MKDLKEIRKISDIKDLKFSMENVFVLLWVFVLVGVLIVNILGQFFTVVLLSVAIWAYFNKQAKIAGPKK